MRTPDLIIVLVYVLSLIGIGLRFHRRQRTTDRYFVAGRSIPGWAAGLSLLATIITSVSFIAYPGAAYAGDWSLLVPGFLFIVVLLVVGRSIVPFFRHTVRMSAYEYFGKRFGSAVRLYASFAFAAGHFAKMGFVFYLVALTMSAMMGWSMPHIIAFTAVTTIVYTMLGGVEAVVWGDVVQGILLWLGMIVSILYLLGLPQQGAHAMLADAWVHGKMGLGSSALRLDQPTVVVLVLYGIFFYLQKCTADQTIVQRFLIARSDRQALRGVGLGALLCIPVWTGFMLIGTLLWSYYRLTHEALPHTLIKADEVFPYFLSTHLPVGLAGLFTAALLGSAMSMLASDMNCLSAVVVEDFYGLAAPRSTDRQRLRVGRMTVVLGGVAAAALGVLLAATRGGALALYFTMTAVVAGGLAGLFLLAYLMPRATRSGALAGIAASLLVTAWATLTQHGKLLDLGRWNYTWHEYMIGVLGNLTLLIVGVSASLWLPGTPIAPELTWRGQRDASPTHIPRTEEPA
jgi:SSS family solute:Na+ symporter